MVRSRDDDERRGDITGGEGRTGSEALAGTVPSFIGKDDEEKDDRGGGGGGGGCPATTASAAVEEAVASAIEAAAAGDASSSSSSGGGGDDPAADVGAGGGCGNGVGGGGGEREEEGDDGDAGEDDDDTSSSGWPSSLDDDTGDSSSSAAGGDGDGDDSVVDSVESDGHAEEGNAAAAGPSSAAAGDGDDGGDDDDDERHILRSWSPSTTHILLQFSSPSSGRPASSSSSSPTSSSPSFDVLDRTFGPKFPSSLLAELKSSGILGGEEKTTSMLRPARTAMDVKVDELLAGAIDGFLGDDGGAGAGGGGGGGRRSAGRSAARGDRSLFVPRSLHRSSPRTFSASYPALHRLVRSVECTAARYLCGRIYGEEEVRSEAWRRRTAIEFDPSLTSVQVASYPGDGRSGYVRHCDAGPECRAEPLDPDPDLDPHLVRSAEGAEAAAMKKEAKRIVTAVYYLTPSDWDEEEDGGCLRVYYPPRSSSSSPKTEGAGEGERQHHHDVAPYPDRLIVFRSDLVEHEVLPSLRRERVAVTVWLYGRVRTTAAAVPPFAPLSSSRPVSEEGRQRMTPHPPASASRSGAGPPPLDLPAVVRTDDEGTESEGEEGAGVGSARNNHQRKRRRPKPRIFVAIPSYRDPETHPTILSLLSGAVHPDRVHVGVVWQVDTTNDDDAACCFRPPLPVPWAKTNLRALTLDRRHATGPVFARALAQTLHRDEEYVLNIDSHMRFRPNWDEYLIRTLGLCRRPGEGPGPGGRRCVLTGYPPGYELVSGGDGDGGGKGGGTEEKVVVYDSDARGTLLVPWKFDGDGMLRQRGRRLAAAGTDSPIPCPLYAAGFAFGPSSMLKDVPYDPTVHQLFFGEEMSMAVRLFTHGYDLFAPAEAVCYHLWSRGYRKTWRSDQIPEGEVEGEGAMWRTTARVRSQSAVRAQLLGRPDAVGLGAVRTADEFAVRIGVDFENRTIGDGAENGGLDPSDFADAAAAAVGTATASMGKIETAAATATAAAEKKEDAGEEGQSGGGESGDNAVTDKMKKEVMGLVAAFVGGASS